MRQHGLSKAMIGWLLEGDVSIWHQVRRDLLGEDPAGLELLQGRIATEGWGARFLSRRHPGAVHFDMEETGGPSRWNTLRAARVMAAYRNLAT
jgi:hypothetical protein